jgi:hypothetical protein
VTCRDEATIADLRQPGEHAGSIDVGQRVAPRLSGNRASAAARAADPEPPNADHEVPAPREGNHRQ